MNVKNILSLVIVIFFVISLLSQNAYALVSITTVTWNDVQIEEGSQVVPSEDRPLEFFFQSNDENNADLTADFQCEILRINDIRLVDPGDIHNGFDIDSDGQLDVAQSDVQQVVSQSCGDNVASSSITNTSFNEGTYFFRVTANLLSASQPVTSDTFGFDVPEFQAGDGEGGKGSVTGALQTVDSFWRKCSPSLNDGTGGFFLQSIEYIIKGESEVDKLHITNQKLKLKIFTNDLNKELRAKLASGSTEEDFRVIFVDTQCHYEGPPYSGGPKTAEDETHINDKIFDPWNPPLVKCADELYKRELEYTFKITSGVGTFKNADTKNIKLEIKVDRTPEESLKVKGEIFLGKDRNNKDINLVIVPEKGPEAHCTGKNLIS